MVTTTVRRRVKVSGRGTSVAQPRVNSPLDTGPARSCGLAPVEVQRAAPKEDRESINLEP